MEIVLRTASGDAELSLGADCDDRSLGEVVGAVTGREAPSVLDVDGRAVAASTAVGAAGVVVGSIVSTVDDREVPPADGVVELVQVAGAGSAARRWLTPGRYRIGVGRKVSAAELELAPVDSASFELDVGPDGRVELRCSVSARLDGEPVDSPVVWDDGLLDVGGRVFALGERDPRGARPQGRRTGGIGGRIPFNRPPRRPAPPPDIATAVRLAEQTSTELWQRRPGDPDAFQFALGLADLGRPALTPALTPALVDLLAERGVGVVGGTEFARSTVNALLVGAAVTHGPADLDVVVLSAASHVSSWEWVKWLPHARVTGGTGLYSTDGQVAGWAAAVRRRRTRSASSEALDHITLVVVDEPGWWRDRSAPLRALFSDPALPLRFVVITSDPADVPAICTTVVSEQPDGVAAVEQLVEHRRVDRMVPYRLAESAALAAARRLAPLDDPDVAAPDDGPLPATVPILALLGLDAPSADAIADRWNRRRDRTPTVTIGVGDGGPMRLDLASDGPHALIVAAPGAGASELLRNLVVGLAAEVPPDEVNVVLADFGRGSLGACAALPHTVGNVVDPHRAPRLLRWLRAELRHRERLVSSADGVLDDDHPLGGGVPLPRLVLVIDEFASVGAEWPDFVPSLVEIGRLGGRLGMHFVLATRHPTMALDEIGETAGLRIALRVHDDADSIGVIGTSDAADLPLWPPGRGYVRLGSGEPVAFQRAHSAGFTAGDSDGVVDVRPYVIARDRWPMEQRLLRRAREGDESLAARSDLERLVEAIAAAADARDGTGRRRPCPDPLPDRLDATSFLAAHPGDGVPFGLLDLPDEQRQTPAWWEPGPDGSLIAYGSAGSGTSSLLATLMFGIGQRYAPDDVHLYVVDADDARLAPFDQLAHVGAVVRGDDLDRVARLVTHLGSELDRRQALAVERGSPASVVTTEPAVVFVIDDVGSLRERLLQRRDLDGVWSEVERVVRDGRPLGVNALLAARGDHPPVEPTPASIPTRLVMRLDDPAAASAFGLDAADLPEFVPGRAVRAADAAELQIATPPPALAEALAELADEAAGERPVTRIGPLPESVTVAEIVDAATLDDHAISVPVGLDIRTGAPALAVVPFGENVTVAGTPGTGRSSVLVAFAAAASQLDSDVSVFAVAPRGGPLAEIDGLDRPVTPSDVSAWVDRIAESTGRRLVLVDDADRLDGPSFARLAALRDPRLIVVLAGRPGELRRRAHWSRPLQRHRHGVLLRPEPSDGDLVRVSLGRWAPTERPHRGVLVVDGEMLPLLAANAESPSSTGELP